MSIQASTKRHRCLIKHLLHSHRPICHLQYDFLLDTFTSHPRKDWSHSDVILDFKQRLCQRWCTIYQRIFLHRSLDHWFSNPDCVCSLWVWMYLRSIVDCLPVALPMEYFAHRVLPTSTLPVITLPVSILHVMYLHREAIARLYFASGTLPVSVKEVVLYQWVPCLQWARHWRAKYMMAKY